MGNELDCCACCQKRGGRGETNWLFDCRFYESEPIWESVQEGKLTLLHTQVSGRPHGSYQSKDSEGLNKKIRNLNICFPFLNRDTTFEPFDPLSLTETEPS